MNLIITELKKIQALVDVTNYLANHNFTYDEAEDLIYMLTDQISTSRICNEYETADDWYNKKPCCEVSKKIIVPLNKIDAKNVMLEG